MIRNYKSILILAVILLTTGIYVGIKASQIAVDEAGIIALQKSMADTLSGVLEISKERYLLVYGKNKLQLALIPPAAMDSLNFHPQTNDTLIVKGINSKGILVVHKAWWKGTEYTFRDSTGLPIWKGTATWVNNPKTCIGCRLCVTNCPTNAITMERNKAVIDQTKCTGCNACITGNLNKFAGCPVKSITK